MVIIVFQDGLACVFVKSVPSLWFLHDDNQTKQESKYNQHYQDTAVETPKTEFSKLCDLISFVGQLWLWM